MDEELKTTQSALMQPYVPFFTELWIVSKTSRVNYPISCILFIFNISFVDNFFLICPLISHVIVINI